MKQELIDIINRFKSSPSVLLTVINKETGQPLVRSISAARMAEQHGSVEAFFNGLFSQGIRQIIVEERRKFGNTTRSFSTPMTFTLGPKEEEPTPQALAVAPATPAIAARPYGHARLRLSADHGLARPGTRSGTTGNREQVSEREKRKIRTRNGLAQGRTLSR